MIVYDRLVHGRVRARQPRRLHIRIGVSIQQQLHKPGQTILTSQMQHTLKLTEVKKFQSLFNSGLIPLFFAYLIIERVCLGFLID